MDRTLKELERTFCAGFISRREFFRRAAFLLASTTATFELLGRLSPRRLAWASSCITLDLSTTDLASQGYVTTGTEPFNIDTINQRLFISDNSTAGHRFFTHPCPEVPTSALEVPILVAIDVNGVSTQGEDTGVHAVLMEGQGSVGITGNEVRAACILRGGERRLAIQLSSGLYGTGIPFDWTTEKTFLLRRLTNGDAEIESGGQIETVQHDRLASSSLANASFALACFLDAATAVARFGPIGMPVFPMTITPTIVQLFPNASEKVHIEGSFALDSSSNGINPVAETVALRLFKPGGSRIYPVGTDKMPVGLVPITGGWSISDAEKARTGIQEFQILQTGDPSFFVFKLVDTRTSLPQADYNQVRLEIVIGDDAGSLELNLVQRNGRWSLA